MLTQMVRFASLAIVLSSSVVASQEHGWTVSASSTDPLVNTTSATGEWTVYYLWFVCAQGGSNTFCLATFELEYEGPDPIVASTRNGFVNAGSNEVFLLAGDSAGSPIVVAQIIVISHPGTISFGPDHNGTLEGIDCMDHRFTAYPIEWIGLGIDAPAPISGSLCEPNVISVETSNWSRMKALYR